MGQPLLLSTDITQSAISAIIGSAFPSGTKLPFFQASAPTGWTIDNTHNDKAMRIVSTGNFGSGSGGATVFSTAWTNGTTSTVAPSGSTDAQSPTGTATGVGDHSHTYSGTTSTAQVGAEDQTFSGATNSHRHTFSGTTSNGGAHSHSVTTTAHSHAVTTTGHNHTLSFTPAFINLIVASKD